MLKLTKIAANQGYKYLTDQVARMDEPTLGERLTDYYSRTGYPPGRWLGKGCAALGVKEGSVVTEEAMDAIFADGCHAVSGEQLGRAFAIYESVEERTAKALNVEVPRVRCRDGYDRRPTDKEIGAALEGWAGMNPERRDRLAKARAGEEAKPQRQACAGFDATFTAAKDISVLWALGDDRTRAAVLSSWMDSVEEAVGDIEVEVAASRRIPAGSKALQVDVEGLGCANFLHFFSRNGDPHLHSHVAVSAIVRDTEGRHLKLDASALYAAAAMLSKRQEAYLIQHLEERLGVSFEWVDQRNTRTPRVAGMPEELRRAFSTRNAQVQANLAVAVEEFTASHGHTPTPDQLAKLADECSLEGRPGARQYSVDEQTRRWQETAAKALHIEPEQVRGYGSRFLGPRHRRPEATQEQLRAMADETLARVLDSQGIWTTRDLQRQGTNVMAEAGVRVDGAEVVRIVEAVLDVGGVVSAEGASPAAVPGSLRRRNGQSMFERSFEQRWTLRAVLASEENMVRATDGPGPSLKLGHIRRFEDGLSDEQVAYVEHLATSGRLVDASTGAAGVGKTLALKALVDAWSEAGHHVHATSPTAAAAKKLGADIGGQADTIDHLLNLWRDGRELPQRGDLILVDEAGMATSLKLDELRAAAKRHGAALRLVGDPRQLRAVGPRSPLGLVAEAVNAPELTGVRRQVQRWEAQASLRLRSGDTSVLDAYQSHGRIDGGSAPAMTEATYREWLEAKRQGKDAMMIAGTHAMVDALSERARMDLVREGLVEAHGVHLSNGAEAGVGDVIRTRRNDSGIRYQTLSGVTQRVLNHDRWRVEAVGEDGSLLARHADNAGLVTLPAEYVRSHVEHSYAHTDYAAQGLTCDVGLGIVEPGDDRNGLYLRFTRGRERNVMRVVTEVPVEERHQLEPIWDTREVLEKVMANAPPATATEAIRESLARGESMAQLAATYETARAEDIRRRIQHAAREAGLGASVGAEAWGEVLTAASRLEAAGRDSAALFGLCHVFAGDGPDRLLDVVATAAALRKVKAEPRLEAGLVPVAGPGTSTEVLGYLGQLAEAMEARKEELGQQVAAERPRWSQVLGPLPENPVKRAGWSEYAGAVAAWREMTGESDARRPVPMVSSGESQMEKLAREEARRAAAEARKLSGALAAADQAAQHQAMARHVGRSKSPRQGPTMGMGMGMGPG